MNEYRGMEDLLRTDERFSETTPGSEGHRVAWKHCKYFHPFARIVMRRLLSIVYLPLIAGKPLQTLSTTALRVRGGAFAIEPELAGKVLTAAFLAQGTSSMLAPKQAAKAYGRETLSLSVKTSAAFGAHGRFINYQLMPVNFNATQVSNLPFSKLPRLV